MENELKNSARKMAKQRGYMLIVTCIAVLIAVISLIAWLVTALVTSVKKDKAKEPQTSEITSSFTEGEKNNSKDESEAVSSAESETSSSTSSASQNGSTTSSTTSSSSSQGYVPTSKKPQYVQLGNYRLDANFTELLLVNGSNPLPEKNEYASNLATIDDKYRQPGYDLNQINKNVYPYMQAMCEAAWADGVQLKVCSPYRSYSIQQTLFNRQVQKWKNNGYSDAEADKKAATIVARPGTSEHNTGLAIDFVKADQSFEQHPAFAWLQEHAAEYGFIMRYPKSKEPITGVIYEAWHYRFVGINEAKKIKASGLCLEEYLEQAQ